MNEHEHAPELDTLITGAIDGVLTDQQMKQLAQRLETDDGALQRYLNTVAMEVLLEEDSTAPVFVMPLNTQPTLVSQIIRWAPLIAASVLFVAATVLFASSQTRPSSLSVVESTNKSNESDIEKDKRLIDHPYTTQTRLAAGEELPFEMPSGVSVSLRGPAQFRVTGSNELVLASGILNASVPKHATGFRVTTPNGDVIDHGTEIGVAVTDEHTELHVFEGKAEAVLTEDNVSSMVGAHEAVRMHHPDNAGYEPIAVSPTRFHRIAERSHQIEFNFDSPHPTWQITKAGSFADRGDRPTSNLTAGESRFAQLNGFVNLPSAFDQIGEFHAGPQFFAPQSGNGRVMPLPFHHRDSMESLCLTSPEFQLDRQGGSITAYITGGRGRAATPPESFSELPNEASDSGFLGLALRRVRDGRYLCSVRRTPGNFYEWAQVEIPTETLIQVTAEDPPNEKYVLDLIDTYQNPHWSWIGLDTVSIPGQLVQAEN